MITLTDIEQAQRNIGQYIHRTPLIPSNSLSILSGAEVYLKLENLQKTGSFKVRGAFNKLIKIKEERVIAASMGNHAQAVAYAAAGLGKKAVVVMPGTAALVKQEATRGYGAEVVLYGERLTDALDHALGRKDARFIHPFDDDDVIAGQGTIGLEIAADRPDVDLVLVPVSGGGLISGIAAAVRASCPRAAVVGVEPELAADARESLRRGERVAWSPADVQRTAADALRVEQVGALPFAHIRQMVAGIVTVSEDEMLAAVSLLAQRARLVAEPGGAAAVAAWLFRRDELPRSTTRVAVVSGGNIDPHLLGRILAAG